MLVTWLLMCGSGQTGDAPRCVVSSKWSVILTSHLRHKRDMSIQLFCVSQPAANWYAICSVCSASALQQGQCAQQRVTTLMYLICVQCCHSFLCHDSSVKLQRAIHCVRMGPSLWQCLEASPSQCSVLCWMHSGRH